MSRLANALHNDYQALLLLRDELALQARLLQAELRDRWNRLEADLDVLREHMRRAEVAAQDNRKEIEAAARLLLDSLRAGYAEIRKALKV